MMSKRLLTMMAATVMAGAVLAQDTPAPDAQPILPENPIPDIISPDPIAPGMPAPEPAPAPGEEGAGEESLDLSPLTVPATPDVTIPPAAATEATAAGRATVVMMAEEDVQAFIRGQTYQGVDPAEGTVVATVQYGLDGTSVLTLPDGTTEAGTYRFDGNTYCTRYEDFRDGTENCFTLEDLGDGRVQAWYIDGRRALILAPAT